MKSFLKRNSGPFRIIASDIVGPLPMSKNLNRFVAINLFSKFTILRAVKTATAQNVTDFIKKDVILKFSCPEILVCDNSGQYKSALFRSLLESRDIKLWLTADYFAQGNNTECMNKTIDTALKAFILLDTDHRVWDKNIHKIENDINSAYHTSTKQTLYFISFGLKMPQHAREYNEIIDANTDMPRDEESFNAMRKIKIKAHLSEARERSEKQYNLHTRPVVYTVGETVYRESSTFRCVEILLEKVGAPICKGHSRQKDWHRHI